MRSTTLAAVVAVVLAGCGNTPPAAPPASQECPPEGGYQIKITVDGITCSDAYALAVKYNVSGEKNQQIDSFTCYSGTAYTRPMIFQCISDKTQFAVFTTPPPTP
jgi:hypothetical protein